MRDLTKDGQKGLLTRIN